MFFCYNKVRKKISLRFKIDKYDSNELLLILKNLQMKNFENEDDKFILKLLKIIKIYLNIMEERENIISKWKKIFSLRLMNEKIDLINNDKIKEYRFKGALKEFKLNEKVNV